MKSRFPMRHFLWINTLLGLLGCFLLSFSLAHAQTSCLAYPSNSTPPSGYGASWDVFDGSKALMVKSNCPASGNAITITVGKGDDSQYVWNEAYTYQSGWVKHTLSGTQSGGWIAGSGTKAVTAPSGASASSPFYFVGYACTNRGASGWKCGCRDTVCTTTHWQLQAYQGNEGGTTGGSWSLVPMPASGTWSIVARDQKGWLTESHLAGGKGENGKRFSFASPDDSAAVKEIITIGDQVGPPGWDSPNFPVQTDGKMYMLRYQMWMDGYYGISGKFFSLMGGRGLAGGSYARAISTELGNDGWGHVSMHPQINGNTQNAIRGYAYSFNRGDTGGDGEHGDTYGSDTVPIPQRRWITVDILSIMNDDGQANGEGRIYVEGRQVARLTGVMWYGPGNTWKTLWMRWRNMYGGNPEDLPASQAATTYYRNFEIWMNK